MSFHLGCDQAHFFQRRRDQSRQANNVRFFLQCRGNDLFARRHDAKIGDFEVVAAQDDGNDVFANVMHVTFYRGYYHVSLAAACGPAATFFFLDVGQEHCYGLFHHACAFNDLGQEHLAVAEQVADHVHAVHQWSFDHVQCTGRSTPFFLGVLFDIGVDSLDQSVHQPVVNRKFPPLLAECFLIAPALELLCQGQQVLGRIFRSI